MMAAGGDYVLRFSFSAAFGKRSALLESLSRWLQEVAAPVLDLDRERAVVTVGFVGKSHSSVSLDCEFGSLAGAAAFLERLADSRLRPWLGEDVGEWVVDASARWELLRRQAGAALQRCGPDLVVQWSMVASHGRVLDLVGHMGPALMPVLSDVGLGHVRPRVLTGVLSALEDMVTVEMDLADMEELGALLAYLEGPQARPFISGIAEQDVIVPGSQNWTVVRKLVG